MQKIAQHYKSIFKVVVSTMSLKLLLLFPMRCRLCAEFCIDKVQSKNVLNECGQFAKSYFSSELLIAATKLQIMRSAEK